MSLTTSVEHEYYQSVGIDPHRVSKKIGTGTQFEVNLFDDPDCEHERVVKGQIQYLSRSAWNRLLNLLTRQTPQQAQKEHDLCREYFKDNMVPTSFKHAADGQRFVMIQDKVDFENITLDSIRTVPHVREQLEHIFNQNGRMMEREGKWLDVAGMNTGKIMWQAFTGEPYTDNLVLDEKNKVLILDCGLFPVDLLHDVQLRFQEINAERFGFRFAGMDGGKK